MNIFFVNGIGMANQYGVGTYCKTIVNGLAGNENLNLYNIEFYHAKENEGFELVKQGTSNITTLRIPNNGLINKNGALTEQFSKAILCGITDLDIIWENSIFHLNSVLHFELACVLKEYAVKIIYTIHVSLWRVFYKNSYEKFIQAWSTQKNEPSLLSILNEKKLCEIADRIICLIEDTREFIVQYYKVSKLKTQIIYNALPFHNGISRTFNKKVLKTKYGLPRNRKVILYVGRLIEDKGFDKLLHVFNMIIKERQDVHLLIAGNGFLSSLLEQHASICGYITSPGYVNSTILNDFYHLSEIGIHPSLNEQSSISVLEMMHAKLPVIVNDIPGFSKPFIHNTHLLKVKTTVNSMGVTVDSEDIKGAVLTLLDNTKLKQQLIRHSEELLKTELNLTNHVSRLIAFYKSISV